MEDLVLQCLKGSQACLHACVHGLTVLSGTDGLKHGSSPSLPLSKEKASLVQRWRIPRLPWVSTDQPPSHPSCPGAPPAAAATKAGDSHHPGASLQAHKNLLRSFWAPPQHLCALSQPALSGWPWLPACCPTQLLSQQDGGENSRRKAAG